MKPIGSEGGICLFALEQMRPPAPDSRRESALLHKKRLMNRSAQQLNRMFVMRRRRGMQNELGLEPRQKFRRMRSSRWMR